MVTRQGGQERWWAWRTREGKGGRLNRRSACSWCRRRRCRRGTSHERGEIVDGPLDGVVCVRPVRRERGASAWRGAGFEVSRAWASWGRRMGSDGARASGGAAARTPKATGAGARCHGAGLALAPQRFNLGYFEHVFLSQIELKCTMWWIEKL
jgi:hypothetical protein